MALISAPKYTIGNRWNDKASGEPSPGPCYVPPAFGSEGAKPYIHGVSASHGGKSAVSAGPGSYNIAGKMGSSGPKYSIGLRPSDTFANGADTPGPAQYSAKPVMKSSPRFSIGVRPERKQSEISPGPADYVTPSDFGKGRAYFHTKGVEQRTTEDTPGPAAYVPPLEFGKNAPKLSIAHRTPIALSSRVTSGEFVALKSTIGDGPKYTMVSRHPDKSGHEITPGPSLAAPTFGSDGPKIAIHGHRSSEISQQTSPGPADFNPTKQFGADSPRIVMHQKIGRDWLNVSESPGPAAYSYNPSSLSTRGGYTMVG